MNSKSYLQVKLPVGEVDPQLLSWVLIQSGAAGTEILEENNQEFIVAFLPESQMPKFLCNANNSFSVFLDRLAGWDHLIPNLNNLLLEMKTSQIADENWQTSWKEGIEPITTSGFYILPGWETDPDEIPQGKIPIWVDHSQAFGTGMHSTTRLCLALLFHLYQEGYEPETIMDLGCGTGILGIAAQKLWNNCRVTFVENDEAALEVTRKVLNLNGLQTEDNLHGSIPPKTTFDLVVANISTPILISLKSSMIRALDPEGDFIFSGINQETEQKFENSFGKSYKLKKSRLEWFGYLFASSQIKS